MDLPDGISVACLDIKLKRGICGFGRRRKQWRLVCACNQRCHIDGTILRENDHISPLDICEACGGKTRSCTTEET